jgi:hypothetical protein
VVYPLINNYKAQRNVRAELAGAVDLGEPVSLYIKEDEIKITGSNLINDNAYKDYAVTGDGGWTKYGDNVITTTDTSIRIASDGSGDEQGAYIYFRNGTRSFIDNDLVVGRQYVLSCFMLTDSTTAHLEIAGGNGANGTTGTGQKELRFTAASVDGQYLRLDQLDTGATKYVELSNIKLFEVVDHTYKLMAVNDTIPAYGIMTEANGNMTDLLSSDTKTALNDVLNGTNNVMDFEDGSDGFNLIVANGFAKPLGNGATFVINSNLGRLSNGAANQGQVILAFTTVSGRTYDISFDIEAVNSTELQASLGATSAYNSDAAVTTSGVDNDYHLATRFTATGTTSYLYLQLNTSTSGHYVDIDDLMIYEVFGYDYYNAPAYKFGIVSSVYDQDTGAMKTTGAAGDQLDVTVQGECNVISGSNHTTVADYQINIIHASGAITDVNKTSDNVLPNSVGVIAETVTSSKTQPIILFQGVEFSEHFVHKNSLQVKAKCDETITKFRPVSLFLDSNGDLLCRHDDIPAETPDADTDHTGVDPGKWGIAELGGVSGDIIPVTVAGKTHITTSQTKTAGHTIKRIQEDGTINSVTPGSVDKYTPNSLGTIMETGTGDIPITIFNGTPIGTITDWKRTIKVTAKANGAITQYRPVSLYLDQYGNYNCISDDIPNVSTDSNNGIWVDFRKWGIPQETVADGENVEIIVQGRTKVNNAKDYADRGEYVTRVTSNGTVVGTDSSGYQLSMLGIVEKESKASDGEPGVIIIF